MIPASFLRSRRGHERGAALLLVLGILAALLLLAVAFSYTTVMDRQSASASADLARARLLAESGVERALAFLQRGLATEIDSSVRFYEPSADSEWAGRSYLPSINGSDTAGIEKALAVQINGLDFTPESVLHEGVGWIPIRSVRKSGASQQEVLLGRLAYLVIDESGKIDPGAVVSPGKESEDETPHSGPSHQRIGASAREIALGEADLPDPNKYRPQGVAGGMAGKMPNDAPWQSMAHMVKAIGVTQAELDEMVKVLHPFSGDNEVFWRDVNANGICEQSENEPRQDITATLRLGRLYDLFVGSDKFSGADDCEWLKELDQSTWVKGWQATAGLGKVQVRRRIAAQVAVNLLDYADADSRATLAHLDGNGDLVGGAAAGAYNVKGVEKKWGLSGVNMQVQVKTTFHEVSGRLNLNPSAGASKEFQMKTPGGWITRDTLHSLPVTYEYEGPASYINLGPKSGDVTITIDEMDVDLQTKYRYNFNADTMKVRLYNDSADKGKAWGQATGQWWIEIEGVDITITPNPCPWYRFRPALKAEAHYPFATSSNNDIAFSVSSGRVVPAEDVEAEVQILGSHLQYKDLYTATMTVGLENGGVGVSPWGSISTPVESNVNDGDNPRLVTLSQVSAGAGLSVKGVSWLKVDDKLSGASDSDWTPLMSADSQANPGQVLVLRNGDSLPSVISQPEEWRAYVADYFDNGRVALQSNQALFLFELETSTSASLAKDYQDLAVLVTLKRKAVTSENLVNSRIEADYLVEFRTDSASDTVTGTLDLVPDVSATVDGGPTVYTSNYTFGSWHRVTAGNGDLCSIERAQVVGMRLYAQDGTLLDECPADTSLPLCTWSQAIPSIDNENYFAGLRAYDPLLNHRTEADPEFSVFWEALPDADYLAVGNLSEPVVIGQMTEGYNSSPYSGIVVKNSPLLRVGELGRVHSYRPMQSLRLWSALSGDEAGHDADILDLFKVGYKVRKRGKINVNSRQANVLAALFSGAVVGDPEVAAKAVLAKRSGGEVFTTIGKMFGSVSGISGTDTAKDAIEEAMVASLAELVSVRQNYFTIIVVAQAIKDVSGVPYDSDGDGVADTKAALNVFDVERDGAGKIVRYIDPIKAEQKVLVVVYRDALNNEYSIEMFEYL